MVMSELPFQWLADLAAAYRPNIVVAIPPADLPSWLASHSDPRLKVSTCPDIPTAHMLLGSPRSMPMPRNVRVALSHAVADESFRPGSISAAEGLAVLGRMGKGSGRRHPSLVMLQNITFEQVRLSSRKRARFRA